MSKVFVLGGNGFIGQHVAIALRQHGYRVSALIRDASQSDDLLRYEVTPIVGYNQAFFQLLITHSIFHSDPLKTSRSLDM
jgi:uncharacterized protein YbjT (DUF2867 family)